MKAPAKGPGRRVEKADASRKALIDAAMAIVNRSGYAAATVARITKRAKLAHGTFYNYFRSRQALLDLLPQIYADRLLEFIAARMSAEVVGIARELARLQAFVDFFVQNRWTGRVITEAATLAPAGYKRYDEQVLEGYVRALRRSVARKEIVGYEDGELETLARLLMFLRAGLAQVYLSDKSPQHAALPGVIATYGKMIGRALAGER